MTPASWCFAFPYAPNEPIRAQAWKVVSEFYTRHFPEIPSLVHSATPVGVPFLRAKTRNDLVRMAEPDFDIVVLIDADTLIHPDGIRRMVTAVTERPTLLGKPFHRGVNRPLDHQAAIGHGTRLWPRGRFNDPGAAWVIRPEAWWRAGGMDENLHSWGGEDQSHAYLHSALAGPIEYDELPAVKTDHETPRWSADPEWGDTREREAVCRYIWQHPELAAEWLTVRDQPGIVDEWIDRFEIDVRRRI